MKDPCIVFPGVSGVVSGSSSNEKTRLGWMGFHSLPCQQHSHHQKHSRTRLASVNRHLQQPKQGLQQHRSKFSSQSNHNHCNPSQHGQQWSMRAAEQQLQSSRMGRECSKQQSTHLCP
jgi:hypothetical protein